MRCQFNTDGPPWKCKQCNWTYARKGEPILSEKPPHRNCPKASALNSPEHRAKIKANTLAELEPMARTADLPAIGEQLDRCVVCERFDGRVCTARGSSCRMSNRWLEFLALMTEPCWLFESRL